MLFRSLIFTETRLEHFCLRSSSAYYCELAVCQRDTFILYPEGLYLRRGEPSLACSLIPIRLPTGTAFYSVCRQEGFNVFSLTQVQIIYHLRRLLFVLMIHELKTSNRHAKTGFLFCIWQIGK